MKNDQEQFHELDQVQLQEAIPLSGEMSNALEPAETAPASTVGIIVEVLDLGQAFLVELFGDWVKLQDPDGLCRAEAQEEGAFRETLGVEVVYPQQMALTHPSSPGAWARLAPWPALKPVFLAASLL